ncbi:MAG: hypothetical protein JNJ58_13550 [Chitinophagaceae bacterium]|nr:hypothetical protein [Chitinophagaceae bacterium]
MKKITFFLTLLMGLFMTLQVHAQQASAPPVEMAGVLHQNGKIYLVVLVLVTIFAGIIFQLIRIERKLNRLEQNNN